MDCLRYVNGTFRRTGWRIRFHYNKRNLRRIVAWTTLFQFFFFNVAFAGQIVIDGKTQTQLHTSGNVTDVTTATVNGVNGFNSFTKFDVYNGNVVNLHLPNGTANLINLVHGQQSHIDGILNSIKNGQIGGNVFFANPYGLVVGAGGAVNVGALTVTTPTPAFMDEFFTSPGNPSPAATDALLSGAVPISETGLVSVRGKVNATGDISLSAGSLVTTGTIQSGAVYNGTAVDFSDVVNINDFEQGARIAVQNGSIAIVTRGDFQNSGVIAADGGDNLDAGRIAVHAGGDIALNYGSVISAKGRGMASSGGDIYVFAENDAVFSQGALIDARGGEVSGDGGAIELSAVKTVSLAGGVFRAGAASGKAGSILIDPTDIELVTTNQYTYGASFTLQANEKITVADGVTISTRNIGAGSDHLNDSSVGNSGDLTLEAPEIIVEHGARLLAHVEDGSIYAAGDISLTAKDTDDQFTIAIHFKDTKAHITLGDDTGGVTMKGGDINISATADSQSRFDDNSEVGESESTLESTVDMFESVTTFAGVAVSDANAQILIRGGSAIEADNLTIDATAKSEAEVLCVGTALGFAYGKSNPTAKAIVEDDVSIKTENDLKISSLADSVMNISAYTVTLGAGRGSQLNATVSIGTSEIESTAKISDGADVTVGGNLDVLAGMNKEHKVTALGGAFEDGSVGIGLAISKSTSNVTASLGGSADVTGSVTVAADSRTPINDTQANSSVGSGAIAAKVIGASNAAIDKAKSFTSGKAPANNPKSSSQTLAVAASFAYADHTNNATAEIADSAVVASNSGSIGITSFIEDVIETSAIATIDSDKIDQINGSNTKENSVAAAVVVGLFANNADARIGKTASVDSDKALTVSANVRMPYEIQWHQWTGIGTITDKLNSNFGIQNGFFTSWAQSSAHGEKTAWAGSGNYLRITNTAEAVIDEGAQVNQNTDYRGSQDVTVEANTHVDTINISGVFGGFAMGTVSGKSGVGGSYLGIDYDNTTKALIKNDAVVYGDSLLVRADTNNRNISISASGGNSKEVSINGTFSLLNITNTTIAQIDDGAKILTGNGTVNIAKEIYSIVPRDEELAVDLEGESATFEDMPLGLDSNGDGILNTDDEHITGIGDGFYTTDLTLLVYAEDESKIYNISGGITASKNVGIGASVSINEITRNTEAVIGNREDAADGAGSLSAGGAAALAAVNKGRIGSYSLAAAVTTDVPTNPDLVKTTPQVSGKYGISISGDVSLNTIDDTALAYISDSEDVSGKDLELTAVNTSDIEAWSGSVAISTQSAGLAGSYSQNTLTDITKAYVDNSTLNLDGKLSLDAKTGGNIDSFAASGSLALKAGLAGSVSINEITNETSATVSNNSDIRSSETVSLSAGDVSEVASITGAIGGGGYAGFGAAVSLITIDHSTQASIEDSDVEADVDISLSAKSDNDIETESIAAAAAKAGMAAAATVSINTIESDTNSHIKGKHSADGIRAGGDVTLTASDTSEIESIAGNITAGGSAGFGASYAKNDLDNSVKAYLEGAPLKAEGALGLTAISTPTIETIAAGGSGATSGSVQATYARNEIDDVTEATISDDSVIDVNGDVGLLAEDESTIKSLAGAVSGGGTASVGAAGAYNDIANTVKAAISNSSVADRADSLDLKAASTAQIKSVSAGGSGAGTFSLGGSVSTNEIDNTTDAHISVGSDVGATGNISLASTDTSTIESLAGTVSGAGSTSIGAAVATNDIGNVTKAYVDDSDLSSSEDAVAISAESTAVIKSLSAGISGSGTASITGAVSHNIIDNTTSARVTGASSVTAAGKVILSAEDTSTIKSLSGQAAVAGEAAVGGAASYNKIHNAIESYSDGSTLESESGNVSILAESDAVIETVAAGGSGGGTAGVAGSVAISRIGNSVEAYANESHISADGSVAVVADADNDITVHGGTFAGAGTVGVGGAVAVSTLNNTTKAYISDGSDVTALGKLEVEVPKTDTSEDSEAVRGLAVVAKADENMDVLMANVSGGGAAGVAATVAVTIAEDQTNAYVDGSDINADNTGAHSEQRVMVRAFNSTNLDASAGGLAIGGTAGVGATENTVVIDNTTRAYINDTGAVNAKKSVEVASVTRERINAVTVSGAGAGTAAVAGSVAVFNVDNINEAYIEDSVVTSGDAITVLADDAVNLGVEEGDSRPGLLAGSTTLGGVAGVGGSVLVTSIGNSTRARITDSETNAAGTTEVKAETWEDTVTYAATGSMGGYVGAAGAVIVNSIETTTEAYLNEDDGQTRVNQDAAFDSGAQDVMITAVDSAQIDSRSGVVTAGAATAVGASIDNSGIRNTVGAFAGSGTRISAGRDVKLRAASDKTVRSTVMAFGGGAVSVQGAVSVAAIGSAISDDGSNAAENTDEKTDDQIGGSAVGGYMGDSDMAGDAKDKSDGQTDGLSVSKSFDPNVAISKSTTAYIGNNAVIDAGSDILITAAEWSRVDIDAGAGSLGLLGAGGAVGVASLKTRTNAYAGNGVTLTAGGGVHINAQAEVSDSEVYSFTGAAGAVGLGAAVSHLTSDNDTSAYIGSDSVIDRANDVEVRSTSTSELDAQADGAVAGSAAAGGVVARAFETGTTKALVDDRTRIGTGDGNGVNRLTIAADADIDVNAKTRSAAAGLAAGAGSDAYAKVSPTVEAYTGDNVGIRAFREIEISATLKPKATAEADGVQAGAVKVGVSKAKAEIFPTVKAYIGENNAIEADFPELTFTSESSMTGNPALAFSTNSELTGDPELTFINDGTLNGAPLLTFNGDGKLTAFDTLTFDSTTTAVTRAAGSWSDDGFEVGQTFKISGTVAGSGTANAGTYTISAISGDGRTLTLSAAGVLTDETIAAADLTKEDNFGLYGTAADTISRDSGSWSADGFIAGQEISVSSSASNDGAYTIASISADGKTLILSPDNAVSAENASGIQASGTAPDRISRNSGSWIDDGFAVDQAISVSGSSGNDDTYAIADISADGREITLSSGYALLSESGTGIGVNGDTQDTIRRSSGNWGADGFAAGQQITISGSSGNDGQYYIDSISGDGLALILTSGENLSKETKSGVEVAGPAEDTISRNFGKWTSDGFSAGSSITISGSGKNDGTYTVASVSADGKALTLTTDNALKNETSDDAYPLFDGKIPGNLTVRAQLSLPDSGDTAHAEAFAAGGGLIGVNATLSDTKTSGTVSGYVGGGSFLDVTGDIKVNAQTETRQHAEVDGYNFGILAAGANIASVKSDMTTEAYLGSGVQATAKALKIYASGTDDNYADAVSGSGGFFAGAGAKAETDSDSTTKVWIGSGAAGKKISAESLEMNAEHTDIFNSRASSVNAAVLGYSGAWAENETDATVNASIGAGADIETGNFVVNATSRARKEWLSGSDYNAKSGSGGVVDAPAAKSVSNIDNRTKILIGNGATIQVTGDRDNPAEFTLNAVNDVFARDKAKIDSGGAISVPKAVSEVESDVNDAIIQVGTDADLRSIGDIRMGARAKADIETKANSKTYGLAGAALGESLSLLHADNRITIQEGAYLRSDGDIWLTAGQDTTGTKNDIDVSARTDLWNKTAIPIDIKPKAHAEIYTDNIITIESNAEVASVKDTYLLTTKGDYDAEGYGVGKDLYRELLAELGSDIAKLFGSDEVSLDVKGGSTDTDYTNGVRVDGTVRVGIQNKQYLTIEKNRSISLISDGIYLDHTTESLTNNIQDEINRLKQKKKDFADLPDVVAAYDAEISRLNKQLDDLGGEEVTVDFINVEDIWAQSSNIHVSGQYLAGSGRIEAPGDTLIEVINHSPDFLRTHELTIPDSEGGRIYFNSVKVAGNAEINARNSGGTASFAEVLTSETSAEPLIHVENTYQPGVAGNPDGMPPDIYIADDISNRLGTVRIANEKGSILSGANIIAKTIDITAGKDFVQSYVNGIYNVGGDPKSHWENVSDKSEKDKVDRTVSGIKSGDSSIIAGNNVFISAQYLNINGTVQSGIPEWAVTITDAVHGAINDFKTQYQQDAAAGKNPDPYLKLNSSGNIDAYYNARDDRIEIEPVEVQGGYMELFGNILSTGTGKLRVIDGYGTIQVTNNTGYDLVVNTLDTGRSIEGKIKITDTAKRTADDKPLTTVITRLGDTVNVVDSTTTDADGDPSHVVSATPGRLSEYQPKTGQYYSWLTREKKYTRQRRTREKETWFWIAENNYDNSWTDNISTDGPYFIQDDLILQNRGETADYWYDNVHSKDEPGWHQYYYDKDDYWAYKYEKWKYDRTVTDTWYHKHGVKAFHPIAVEFIGQDSGSISVSSSRNLFIDGNISNPEGVTTLTASGAIEQTNANAAITAMDLSMTAATGIGNTSTLRTDLQGGVLSAATTAGDVRISEIDGSLVFDQIGTGDGDVVLSADMDIVASGDTALIRGGRVTLAADSGGIGTADRFVRIDTGDDDADGLEALAAGDIFVAETAGDLRLDTAESLGGDVTIRVLSGTLLDNNPDEAVDTRTRDQLLALWEEMQLTGDGAEAAAESTVSQYEDKKGHEYRTYWRYRNRQADPDTYDPNFEVPFTDDELNYFKNDLGWSDAQLADVKEQRTKDYHDWNGDYGGGAYDPNWTYTATAEERQDLKEGAVWTEDQLKYSVGAGVVKETSDTEVRIEAPNVRGRNVTIQTAGGVGVAVGEETIDVSGDSVDLTDDQKVALAGAERDDLTYYDAAGNEVDRNDDEFDSKVTTIKIAMREDVDVEAAGTVTIEASGHVYLGSEQDVNIDRIGSNQSIRIKGSKGIYNVALGAYANITGGNLILEASDNSIGTPAAPVTIALNPGATLTARAGENIYITEQPGSLNGMNVDGIYAVNHVSMVANGSILDAYDDALLDIRSESLNLRSETGSIGSMDNLLEINLDETGTLTASGYLGVFLQETAGNLNVNRVEAAAGEARLVADGSIVDALNTVDSNIDALNIDLTAITGTVGTADNRFEVDAVATFSANAYGEVNVNDTAGNVSLMTVVSQTGNVSLIAREGSILDANAAATNVSGREIELTALNGGIVTDTDSESLNAHAAADISITETDGLLHAAEVISDSGNVVLSAAAGDMTAVSVSAGQGATLNATGNMVAQTVSAATFARLATTGGMLTLTSLTAGTDVGLISGTDLKIDRVTAGLDITATAGGSIIDSNAAALNLSGQTLDLSAVNGGIELNIDSTSLRTAAKTDIHLTEAVGVLNVQSAVSDSGSVFLTAQTGAMNITLVRAGANAELSAADGAMNISAVNAGADALLSASGGINLNTVVAGGKAVLTAGGSITDTNSIALNISAPTVDLTASAGSIDSDIDSANLRAKAQDDVDLMELTGALNVESVSSTAGDVLLIAATGDLNAGKVSAAAGNAVLVAANSILDRDNDTASDVDAGSLVLMAVSGGIGAAGNPLDSDIANAVADGTALINAFDLALPSEIPGGLIAPDDIPTPSAGGLIATAPQDIFVNETDGLLNVNQITSSGGSVSAATGNGSMDIRSIIAAVDVHATAQGGSILDANAAALNIQALNIDLTAVDGGIDTDVDSTNLRAAATANIDIMELTGDLNIERVESTGGNVNLNAPVGNANVGLVRSTAGTTTIAALGSIQDRVGTAGSNIDAAGIVLTALTGGIGEETNYFDIDSSNAVPGTVAASAPGNIYLNEVNGALRVNQIRSDAGDLWITSDGSILNGRTDGGINLYGANMTLASFNGSIGEPGKRLVSEYNGNFSMAAATGIYLEERSGDFAADTIVTRAGSIDLLVADGNTFIDYISAPQDVRIESRGDTMEINTIDPTNIDLWVTGDGSHLTVSDAQVSNSMVVKADVIGLPGVVHTGTGILTMGASGNDGGLADNTFIQVSSPGVVSFSHFMSNIARVNGDLDHLQFNGTDIGTRADFFNRQYDVILDNIDMSLKDCDLQLYSDKGMRFYLHFTDGPVFYTNAHVVNYHPDFMVNAHSTENSIVLLDQKVSQLLWQASNSRGGTFGGLPSGQQSLSGNDLVQLYGDILGIKDEDLIEHLREMELIREGTLQ